MTEEKPLFIPLRTEWFRQFEAGTKDTEYRAYGPRWNEKTCRVGRPATVSHGYSGKRLARRVASFKVLAWADAPETARSIYPNAAHIAAIELPPAVGNEGDAMKEPVDHILRPRLGDLPTMIASYEALKQFKA